jgi:DNA-binding response OmpR family regulator
VARILVVDDDSTVAEVVAGYLERAGHAIRRAADGVEALSAVEFELPDLVVLDLMLPRMGGLEVCRRLRASHPGVSIIMLTALAEEEDRIAGLELGADDYVTKPFSPRELVLRVESVLRRSSAIRADNGFDAVRPLLQVDGITVDPAARRAFKDGVELALTVRELDLLTFLMSHPGVAFSRAELMSDVWGWTFGDQSTVTVHVRRLREKVETDPANPTLIQTVWGVGYRLEAT